MNYIHYKHITALLLIVLFVLSIFASVENVEAKTYTYTVNKFIKEGDALTVVGYPNGIGSKVMIKRNNKEEVFFQFDDFSSKCVNKNECTIDISTDISYHLLNRLEGAGAITPNERIVKPDLLGVIHVTLEWDSGIFCQNHQIVDYYIEVNGINLN